MRTRKSQPELTVHQRRRQIIDILAIGLVRMPDAINIPPTPSDAAHDRAEQNLSLKAETGLDVRAN
ncbi:MAG: hypothetical protein WD534_12765 [Phycisphaeraceae bacterium]